MAVPSIGAAGGNEKRRPIAPELYRAIMSAFGGMPDEQEFASVLPMLRQMFPQWRGWQKSKYDAGLTPAEQPAVTTYLFNRLQQKWPMLQERYGREQEYDYQSTMPAFRIWPAANEQPPRRQNQRPGLFGGMTPLA
jgi:hypothetical protein